MGIQALTRKQGLILLATVAIIAVAESRLEWVVSRSVSFHVALRVADSPKRGDYVSFTFSYPLIDDGHHEQLTKKLACTAGEQLTFDGRRHRCDGIVIDQINLDRLTDGRPVPAFIWNGPVPPGKAYVVGTHPRSLDSRYFGFVDASTLHKVVGLL